MKFYKLAKRAKEYNEETFEIGGDILIATTFETYNSWGHIIWSKNQREYVSKICYMNRTWEQYTYQSALQEACNNLGIKEAFKEYDKKRTTKEHEECEKFIESFKNLYETTSPATKKALENITITSEQDANKVMAIMEFDNLLNQTEKIEEYKEAA